MSAPRRRSRLFTTSAFGALALAAFWAAPAQAQLVQGATPAQSNGAGPSIDQSVPNTTTVTLGGSRTVIDWDKFDINSGDTANFVFANRSDIVLNRVGGAGSTINGNLNGTIGSAGGTTGGNIWIYNANGVVIGANARVSTGGLLVTTAALDRATDSSAGGFLDGSSTSFGFTGAGTGNITVQNGAQIASHGGAIALVAPVVTTEAGSSISAQDGGNVLVGSASKYQISFRPTSTDDMDLLSFEVADGAGTSGTDAINLAGDISGNRVFVAAVSKPGLVASIMNTGTISATTVGTDETGAIVLSANHDIVNGVAAAAPLANVGAGYVTTYGGSVAGPKVDFVASENVLLRGDVGETGATVNLHSDNTDIKQYAGVITADTLTASAQTGINFNSFSANKVDKLGDFTTVTGDLAYIGDEDGVILTGAISAPGKVTLGARGFMDTTTGSISSGSLELSLGGGGSFKVIGDANIGYGQSQGAVTVHATGGITLSNEFGMLLGDTLTLTADAGAIRETGGFISGGGAVVANAAGEIDLGGANSFTSLTANSADGERVTVNATGNLDFKVNTFSLARFTVGGNATSSGTNALNSGGLFVTAGGAINLSSDGGYTEFGDLSAGGNITLAMDGNLVLGGVIHAGNALSLTSRGGAIRQTSGTISLGTSFTLNAVTGIDLNQTGNHLGDQSLVSMATGGTGSNVRIRGDAMKLYLHGALGNVSLYGESGDVVVGPGLTASSLTAEAARDIQIGSNGNTVAVDTYHRLIGTNVSVYNNGDFTVDGDVGRADVGRVELVAPNGTLTQAAGTIFGADISLRATYAIKQDSGASVQGSNSVFEAIAGTDLLLTGANRFSSFPYFSWGTNANVTIRSVGDLYVDTGTPNTWLVPVHTLKLISDEGNVGVYGGFVADTLNVEAHGDILLDDATYIVSKVGSVTGLTSATGNISFKEDDGFDIAGDISAAGLVHLDTSGAITASAGHLSADTLELTSGSSATLNVAGNLKLGAVDSGSVGGGNFILNSDGDIELTGAVHSASVLSLTTSNGAVTTNGGTVSAFETDVSASGAISLVSNNYANFWAVSTGGGDIHLAGDFDLRFGASTTGALIVDAHGQAISNSDVRVGSLSISAGTGISLTSGGGYTVDIGSFSGLATTNGSISVDIAGDIKLDGDVTAGGTGRTVSLNAGGSILQNSGAITGDALSLSSSGNVSLGGANNFQSIANLNVGGDLTLRNLGSINLDPSNSGGYSSGGQLSLTSDTGDITAGNIVTASKLTASAVNGSILLGGGGHQIDSLGTLTAGGDIEIGTSSTGFSLTGNITATNLTLLAQNGGIIQNTGTTITADHLTATANGGISIDQLNAVGTVDGLNANLFTTGHNIAFRNAGDITLDGLIDARGGTLRLTSNTGGITQNNGAGIYVLADQLFLSGVGDVLLNSTSNNIATLIGASSTNGGILYRDANGFDIAGNITATTALTGGVSLRTAGPGSITQSGGIIDVDYLGAITVGGGSVTLNQANRIHKLIATSGNGTLSLNTTADLLIDQPVYFGTVSLNSGGAITESTNGSFSAGTANLSAVTGINLPGGSPSGNNSIQNFGTITNTTSGGINIVNYSGLGTSLTGFITAAGQTVSISDIAGGINQTGGGIAADTLNLSATGGISATRNNVVANLGTLSAGGAIAFTNVGSFNISQSTDATGNSLTLSSIGGAITQRAGTTLTADTIALAADTTISQAPGAALHATNLSLDVDGNVTLGEANDFTNIIGLAVGGNLTLRNYGSIDLSPGFSSFGYGSGGALILISDTGNINSTNEGVLTSRLTAYAAGSISLAGTLASLGTITAGQSILLTTYNGNMVLTGNVTGRNISLYGNTGLSQTGGIIDADRLNVITNGNISLTGANQIDVVGRLDTDQYDSGTGHDITLHNVGAIVLDYQIEAPDGTVTLTSDTGGISQTIFSSLFTAGTLNASAAGDIVLDYAGNNVGRVTGLQSSSGNITFNEADGFDIYGDITTPGSVSLSSGGAIETYTGHLSADTLAVTAGDEVSLSAIGNIKLGAVDTSGGGLTSGGNFYLGTDGDIALTGAVTTGNHDLILETTGGAITTNGGTVSVNYNGVGGVTYATAKGGIDLVSAGNALIWATSTNGGDVNLTGDNDVYFMVNTGGDLTVNAGGSAGNNSDVIARSVGITAGTGISLYDQTVTINVGSYRYLTVADGFIDVENQGDINLDGNVTAAGGNSGNSIRLNSSLGSLLQNSGTISGYGVELDAAQSVTQDASATVVAGDNGLSLRGTDVSLLGANEIPSINTYTVTHDLTLRAVGSINMSGSANQAGSNHYTTLISDTGDIIGGPINAARLSATATNGKLVFNYGNNHIGSLGDLTAKNTGGTDIDIFSDSLLGLTGDITGGGVNIYATQGVNQTGGAITADRLYTGTNGDLLLGGANNFGQLLDFGHGNGKNVTIRNLGSITLPGTANSVGTLTLTSDTGSIGQTSAITVTSLIAHAATGINLTQANNFTTLSGLTTGTGDIRIADTGGFAIEGDITAPGTVALASTGNITTGTTTVGSVTTPHGKVDADTLTVSAVNATVYTAGDIKLGASSVSSGFTLVSDGNIDLTATSTFNAASLIANAGSITQSGGIVTGNTVVIGAAGSITLDKNNSLSSFGGTSTGGGAVTFNNVGTSTLDLSISTTGNAVVTTAGGVLGAYIRASDLSLTAGGAIDLTFNTDVNSVSKLVTTSGSVRFTDNNSFQILGDVTAGTSALGTVDLRANTGSISQFDGTIKGDDVHLTSVGNLSQVGTTSRIVANTIALSGYAIIFNGANSFNSTGSSVSVATNGGLILRNAGSIDLDALGGFTSGGNLALTSDNGSITATGAIAATALSALAEHGTISFGNAANSFTYLGVVSASGDATITTSSTSLSLLNNISVGGRLTLGAQGAITQTSGTLQAASLYATAGGGAGAITLGAGNDVDTLGALTATGDVSFRDIDGFEIQGNVSGDHVSLAAGGQIYEKNGSTLTANHLTASAVDGLQLNQAANSIQYIDSLTLSGASGGSLGIASSGGDMHLAGNVAAAGQYVTFYVAGGSFLQDSGTITAANLGFTTSDGGVTLGANNIASLGSINVRDDFTANADLSSGVLGLNGNIVVGGTTTITNSAGITQGQAGSINTYNLNLITAGTLDMGNVINMVGGQANIEMGSGSFLSYLDLNLRLNATGAATITSYGNINFTGAGSSSADTLTLSAANGIYSGAGAGGQIAVEHLGAVTNSGSGGIALNLLGNVTLEGDVTAAGQTVLITAEDGLSQATGNVITANRLNVTTTGTNASAILDNANLVGTFGLNVTGDATLRSALVTTIAPSLSVGGSLTVNTPADITMNNGTVGGTLALYSGGAIYSNGYLSANRLTGSAAGDFYLDLTNLNYLDAIESGEDIQINASSANLNIVGDITAAGGIELSGHTLSQSAGTITAATGIGLSTDGAITQTGGRVIANYISATGGDISLLGANQVGATGNYLNSSGLSIAFRNQGDIVANSDFSFYYGGGLLTLISDTGSITQSTALGVGYVKLQAATGIDFSNSGNTIGSISEATNSTSGGIVLVNSGDLRVDGGITATGQAVSLTSVNGAVSQAPAGIISANSLGVSAQTGVQLHANNNIREITGLSNAVSGGISFNNFLGYELTGNVTAAGQQVTLDSSYGGLTQSGGIITAGNVTSSADGLIRLDMANNVGSTTASSFSSNNGNIFFRSANAILLGTVNAPGLLSLTADTGDITQTVAISADRLAASAVGGDVVLDQLNTIGTLNDVAALDGISLRTSTGLTLDGEITAHDLVKLVAGGDITQVGTGAIHSDFLEATSGVGAANGISLLNHNQVGQATLNSNGKDLRFRNTGDFALGNISAAGHIVEMISDTGSVTQLAGTSILAGTFSATGTNVVLDNTGNQISRIGLISTGSDLSLRNTVALQIDQIDAAGHTVTINNGDNVTGGNIIADKLTLNLTGGYVDLSTANHVASLGGFSGYQLSFTNDESFTISGAIQNGMYQTFLTSLNGAISMAAGGAVNSGGITVQAATGISLSGSMGYVYGATTTTGDVTLSGWGLDIQGDISGDTVTLSGTVPGGFVRQTSGSITANLLNGASSGDFDLTGGTNHIAALGTFSTNGHINITSLDAVDLTGNIDTGDTLTLNAGGAVSQTGGRIKGYWLDITAAGDIDLGATNLIDGGGSIRLFGDDVTFVNDGSFVIDQINAGTHAIDLTSLNGNIWQSNVMAGGSITASAHGSLSLNQGNAIDTIGKLSAGTELTYNSSIAYELTDDITAGTTVTLNGSSGINQTGGAISGQSLIVAAGSADLRQANTVGQLGGATTSGDFLFRNVGDIELWGSTNSVVGGKFGLYSDTGSVTNPGALFTANIIDITAAGGINLNGGSFNYIDHLTTQAGDITVITTSNIVAGNLISAPGTVDLTVGRITAGSVKANLLNVDATGDDIELTGDNEIGRLGYLFGDNISLAVGQTAITGYINATNSIAFVRSGLATDFALTTAGGALRAQMISVSNTGSAGTATLSNITTPASALELNFNFNGNASVTASSSAIYLNNATVDGDLALHASGTISNSGAHSAISGTISAESNTGDVSLNFGTDTVGHFGDILAGGHVGLGAASVDLTGTVQSGGGVLFLTANNGAVTQAGGSLIASDRIEGSATGDFLLTGANHISTLGAITAANGDIAVATDRSLTIDADVSTDRSHSISLISTLASGPAIQNSAAGVLHTGTLNVQAVGDVVLSGQDILRLGLIDPTLFSFSQAATYDITTDIVADAVVLASTAGEITQSGGVIHAASATLTAQNGITLLGNNAIGSLSLSTLAGDIDVNNIGDLTLTSLDSPGNARVTVTGGGLTIGAPTITVAGDLSLAADNNIAIASAIDAEGDVSVTSQSGAVNLFTVRAGDDITVGALGAVSITGASIGSSGNDSEGDGHNMVFGGDSVTFGASNAAGIVAANALLFNGATGSVTINAGAGGAAVNLDSMDQAVSINALGTIQAQANTGDLLLDSVSGGSVSLSSVLGAVNVNSAQVSGDYTLFSHTGFSAGALSPCNCGIANLTIIQETGDLFLPSSMGASGNILITVAGGALDADPGVQLGATGNVEIHASDIGIGGLGGADVALFASNGTIDVRDFVIVGHDYRLEGASFSSAALSPLALPGTQTGTWTINAAGGLSLGGLNLSYNGDIDLTAAGLVDDGSVTSNLGSISIDAPTIDLQDLLAAGSVNLTSSGGSISLFSATGTAGNVTLDADTVAVGGFVTAGLGVSATARNGDARVGYATAGADLLVSAVNGDAILRQATLTGATGDLTIQSDTGIAVLGADDYLGIASDNYLERAAGSTGTVNVLGGTGASVNLDHSAALGQVSGDRVDINVLGGGDLTIDALLATNQAASAYLEGGSLTVNRATGYSIDLVAADGDLTLGSGGFTTDYVDFFAAGTLDATAVPNLYGSTHFYAEAGTIRAAGIGSGGDLELYSNTGGITVAALDAAGDATVSAYGDLAIDRIALTGGGQFSAGGTATVRSLTAMDGFALVALGNVTLGADAGATAGATHTVVTGGTLAGCGCGSGGGTVVSLGGDVTVNLLDMSGIFDTVASNSGNVDVRVTSGDLGIYTLAGHDIAASAGGVLTLMDAESSGGSFALTAADFGSLTLSPTLFGGATRMGDVTIIDTAGNLNSSGWLASSGDIHVEAQGGAITGGLILDATGDVTAIGQGVSLQQVTGRDVTIDAGTGAAGISNSLSIGRNYILTAGDFAGNALAAGGARTGSATITDTVGNFDFGSTDLAFGGAISISAAQGLLNIGHLQAGSAISLNAAGDLSLASATLTGTGANTLSLVAGGGLLLGAIDDLSIASTNVFSNAGTSLTTDVHAGLGLAFNLYSADRLGDINGGTVEIRTRTGDLTLGDIAAIGAVVVNGPSGTLTLGDVTTNAGHINILGQGDVTTGDLSGHFVINLGASAGSLRFGTITGGDVALTAAGGIAGTSVSANTLGVVAVSGDVDLGATASHVASLGTVTVNNGDFTFYNAPAIALDGNVDVANGTVALYSDAGLAQGTGTSIRAQRLEGGIFGPAQLNGSNRIAALGQFSSNGFSLANDIALAVDGQVDAGGGSAVIASHGGMTLTANGRIVSSAAGDAITLASDGLFTNLRGADALSASAGRWLVYTQAGGNPGHSDPSNDFGGLAGTSYYGDAYDFGTLGFAAAPNAGNRFVYGYRPVLTVTPSSLRLVYDGTAPTVTATVAGLVHGDSAADAWSGAADISGVGSNAGTYFAYASLGSLASEMGYSFAFVPGTVIIDPRVISVVLNANDRTYDGTTGATGTLTLNGVIAGDTVTANAASMTFDDKNAGTRAVTAGGITLSGASAGNYIVSATTTDLADILAKAITATLTANARTYDGTTAATGTLALNGLVGNDQVSAGAGAIAFDSKNAGTRTATASGITLSGTDAGNYTVNASATALADILAKAITATLAASDRSYDGTTAATGTLSLAGVIGNDQVSAAGSYAFDTKNAGTGKTVTASGIALSGADAGNYSVNVSTTALASILAKAITATLAANGRTYDGTSVATGTLSLNGVISGDAVGASAASIAFDGKNAGSHTATASGIALTGADAANYTVNGSATALATILAKAISATLTADGRVYDGTAAATGTLALNGVLSGDQVTVGSTGIAFDSKNAGSRTATASGLTLGGADAANYTIGGTATGTATITPRAITATATADGRTYDGTTAATGRIALTGVISGDTVSGAATYRFADANAGTGKAVQVSGLALSGVDAANYTVSLSGAAVTADIARRSITVTAKDATKIFGQPDPALGYSVTTGSLVNGDAFSGALARDAGEQAGRYVIGLGTLALSANYLLTVVPGTLAISFTQSGADASDALKMLRVNVGIRFSVNQDPSRNLEGDGAQGAGSDGDK
ncbi:YDG domain-containing protein [Sphingomonas sp. KR3-1]|uniref:YDG domain-containing protein n=1 Tax=Sphingomonas sp. KR3-1 TaxID=3156611 RepID=UPI0032B39542